MNRTGKYLLVAGDRRAYVEAWEQWVSQPIAPELRFRPMPAPWCRTPIPRGLSKDETVACSSGRAVMTGMTHVLVWSRKEEAGCYPDGSSRTGITKPGDAAGPCSTVAGVRVVFGGHA